MLPSELVDGRRILSVETSNEPGPYKLERAWYHKEPTDVFADPRIQKITLMWASRTGKTTVLENGGIFNKMVQDTGNILVIQPTDKKGKRWSKTNLRTFIRDNPMIQERMPDQNSRSAENEILFKPYTGGLLVIGGANVPGSLSSWSMEEVLFDETDEYPPTAEKEGDPIELGMQRAENFPNKKFCFASTPTIKGASRIEESWLESDQRLYYVPCPHCGTMQILIFSPKSMFAHLTKGYLKFLHKGNEVTYVAYECGDCHKDILPRYKHQMVRNGEWRKLRPQVTDHAGFQISRLYSPWVAWKDVAQNFLRTHKRPERYMVFVNKALSELFTENISHEFTEDEMLMRREVYEKIPTAVAFLTLGVDVQDNRLVLTVWGWGREQEAWLIEYAMISGSPEEKTTWDMLDEYITRPREFENGFPSKFGKIGGILGVAVDSSDHSKEVNAYVKARKNKRLFAVKGAKDRQKDFVIRSANKKLRNPLILIDTFQGKKSIYFRLNVEAKKDEFGKLLPTPQYMHFPMSVEKEFFDQLTSERLIVKRINGHPRQVWSLPSGRENHVLDATDYALGALHVITPGGARNIDIFLDRIKTALELKMQNYNSPPEKGEIQRGSDPQLTDSGDDTHSEPSSEANESKDTETKFTHVRKRKKLTMRMRRR